jgi:hypothetical protein
VGPLFLDYPNMGTTYCQVEDLVRGVDHPQRRLFKPLLMRVAYACHQRAGSQDSAILMDWKHVARSQHSLPILTRLWSGGEEDDEGSEDEDQSELKDPPEIIPQAAVDFDSLFVGGRRSRPVSVPKPPQRRASVPSPKRARTMSGCLYIRPPPRLRRLGQCRAARTVKRPSQRRPPQARPLVRQEAWIWHHW